MKFDDNTIAVLKNFSSINQSIVFKPGKTLATIAPAKSIIARANLENEITDTFAIYDLSRFLATLSLFDSPELEIREDYMEIKKGNRKIKYFFAEPSFITQPPEKNVFDLNKDVEFELKEDQLQELMKALSVLMLSEIAVIGDGSKIKISAADSKINDNYSIEVGETDKNFKMVFKAENIRLIGGSYDVVIDKRGISKWNTAKVEYYITVEDEHSFFND